ncbi:MAG: cobalamin-dependent protein [Eubacterium sp.]
MSKLNEVKELVSKGKTKLIEGAVQGAVDEGCGAQEILDAMIETMGEVGVKFSRDEIFVPEMLIAAKAMKKGLGVIEPLMTKGEEESLGTCIIGTVQGDLHDIGKNLVSMMLKSTGFDVIDLGVDVAAETFIEAIKTHLDVKLVAFSGLLTTTMPALKESVMAAKNCEVGDFKILVGGAPVTQEFADEIRADAYAPDAGSVVAVAKQLAASL